MYKFIFHAIFALLYTSPAFANRLAQCRICWQDPLNTIDPCAHCNYYLDNRDPVPTRHQIFNITHRGIMRCYPREVHETEEGVCHTLRMCTYYGHNCLEGPECHTCGTGGLKNYTHYHKHQAVALECNLIE